MSIIQLTFNTATKEMTLTEDGSPIQHVKSISFCPGWSDPVSWSMNMDKSEKSKENDTLTYTSIYASETPDASNLQRIVSKALRGK